ncbi:DegT/DnrJ/EryC1/StrS family aminotransferase [Sulfurimonas diazotrophicus]|uniref:DegT/DnrJ/EryC1/StrS family aminotransferase n=1 Tax=Sulfurimonas diazotrophicus TaxID=3131939 RepID=A0ABZ3H8P5_9BACT
MKVPFYRPEIGPKERNKVEQVLQGDAEFAVEDLEANFENYIGCGYALATSHGTAALHLAMLAIDLKRGDKVLCSVNAFPAVPEVVRHFDAEPIFVDVNEWTMNMDIDKLERYLEANSAKKLKAVIVSHIAGQPMDLDRLYNIAKIYNVKIVEDASDALGATYKGKKIGSTGADITCFSFSPHMKQTISNGGMLVTDDAEMMERATLLRNHAMVRDDEGLSYIYDVVDIGSKYTMSPIEAAFNDAFISHQDKVIARQKEVAARYSERLKGVYHITPPEIHGDHAFSNYIIKIDKNRDGFARDLLAKGIETGLHYIPLHLMAYYKNKYNLRINDFPIALRNYQQVLSLPIYGSITDKEVDYICDAVIELAKTRV